MTVRHDARRLDPRMSRCAHAPIHPRPGSGIPWLNRGARPSQCSCPGFGIAEAALTPSNRAPATQIRRVLERLARRSLARSRADSGRTFWPSDHAVRPWSGAESDIACQGAPHRGAWYFGGVAMRTGRCTVGAEPKSVVAAGTDAGSSTHPSFIAPSPPPRRPAPSSSPTPVARSDAGPCASVRCLQVRVSSTIRHARPGP